MAVEKELSFYASNVSNRGSKRDRLKRGWHIAIGVCLFTPILVREESSGEAIIFTNQILCASGSNWAEVSRNAAEFSGKPEVLLSHVTEVI
jgi:hypothetical protein